MGRDNEVIERKNSNKMLLGNNNYSQKLGIGEGIDLRKASHLVRPKPLPTSKWAPDLIQHLI